MLYSLINKGGAMDFVRYSDSLRAKLHLGGIRLPLLIGCTVCAVLAILAISSMVISALNEPVLTIDKGATSSADAAADIEGSTAAQKIIFVHVAGQVIASGLYELPDGSRLQQAIEAAGGFSEDADTESLNLARTLADGEQIIVPQRAELAQGGEAGEVSGTAVAAQGQASSKVNINTASLEVLQTLKGVGASTAQRIIDDREANGPYKTIEDLKRVSGIGDKKFAAIASDICVG